MATKRPSETKVRRFLLWVGLVTVVLLAVLSVYGAFLGAERAEGLFNSLPLAVYWVGFSVLLGVSFWVFPRFTDRPGLASIHLGCVFVLLGGMVGSRWGHDLQRRLLGTEKIRRGRMVIYEGASENRVYPASGEAKELGFSLRLKDFRMEYYEPGVLQIESRDGAGWRVAAEAGTEYELGGEYGKVRVLRKFENFKLVLEGDERVAVDAPGPDSNPAVEVELIGPDGSSSVRYVFERFRGHAGAGERFALSYFRMVRDYVSEIEVVADPCLQHAGAGGEVVTSKDIEVNHPLHWGGYRFYQSSYDDKEGKFTVLQVVSDTGLAIVWFGYALLCIGVFAKMWGNLRPRKTAGSQSAHRNNEE